MNWEEASYTLGVLPTATEKEIHQQYLYKVQLLHPDWNANKPLAVREKAEQELMLVNAAYNFLKDSVNNPLHNPPKLDVTVKKVRFKNFDLGEKRSTSFEIKNLGGPFSKIWIDDSPAPWLRVTDIKSLAGDLLPAKVTIEATGTGEPNKHYACSLALRLENEDTGSKDETIVRVELWMKAEPGTLKLKPKTRIRFRAVEPNTLKLANFVVDNAGHGPLRGHLSTNRPWLSVSPNIVGIEPLARKAFTATLSTAKLRRGFSDKAFVNIITDGGNDRIPVELSIARLPFNKLHPVLTYTTLGILFALPFALFIPGLIDLIHLPAEYLSTLGFWAGMGVYLGIIAGAIARCVAGRCSPKTTWWKLFGTANKNPEF